MRRTIFLTVASMSIVLTLPAVHLNAVCEPPPAASSTAGIDAMRAVPFIIYGTIENAVPTDAHAAHSFFLRVKGYFRGAGPGRVEVSDYSDGDLPTEALIPGASIDAATQFVEHFAGQSGIVFATRESAPFTGQFRTTACTYTAYGDAAVADILPLLRRTFGEETGPTLPTTGPGVVPLSIAVASFLLAGGALIRLATSRPKLLPTAMPPR